MDFPEFYDIATLNSIVWNYLKQVNEDLATKFQLHTNATHLGKNGPTLEKLYQHYKNTHVDVNRIKRSNVVKRSYPDVLPVDRATEKSSPDIVQHTEKLKNGDVIDLIQLDDLDPPPKRQRMSREVEQHSKKDNSDIINFINLDDGDSPPKLQKIWREITEFQDNINQNRASPTSTINDNKETETETATCVANPKILIATPDVINKRYKYSELNTVENLKNMCNQNVHSDVLSINLNTSKCSSKEPVPSTSAAYTDVLPTIKIEDDEVHSQNKVQSVDLNALGVVNNFSISKPSTTITTQERPPASTNHANEITGIGLRIIPKPELQHGRENNTNTSQIQLPIQTSVETINPALPEQENEIICHRKPIVNLNNPILRSLIGKKTDEVVDPNDHFTTLMQSVGVHLQDANKPAAATNLEPRILQMNQRNFTSLNDAKLNEISADITLLAKPNQMMQYGRRMSVNAELKKIVKELKSIKYLSLEALGLTEDSKKLLDLIQKIQTQTNGGIWTHVKTSYLVNKIKNNTNVVEPDVKIYKANNIEIHINNNAKIQHLKPTTAVPIDLSKKEDRGIINNADSSGTTQELDKSEHYKELLELGEKDIISNTEDFTCGVCLTDYGVGEGVMLHQCLHTYCRECLVNLIKHCDEAQVKCPYRCELDNTPCGEILLEREIKALVTVKSYDEYLMKSLKLAENGMEDAFHCRTPDCPGWIVYDQVVSFQCPRCLMVNCIPCQAQHPYLTCDQYQHKLKYDAEFGTSKEELRTKEAIDKLVTKGEAMICPKCRIVVMKEKGTCDWVKCSSCHLEICWATKGPRWGPKGAGDTSGGCRCKVMGVRCHPSCHNCH